MCIKLVLVFVGMVILLLLLGFSPVHAGWRDDVGQALGFLDLADECVEEGYDLEQALQPVEAVLKYESAKELLEIAAGNLVNLQDVPIDAQQFINDARLKIHAQIQRIDSTIECLFNTGGTEICLSDDDYTQYLIRSIEIILNLNKALSTPIPATSLVGLYILSGLMLLSAWYLWSKRRKTLNH